MTFAVRVALVVAGLLLVNPPVKASNARSSCLNNLRGLYWALQVYHEVHGSLPTDICDARGRPLLSWRVRLLPYIDSDLLGEFRLSESWDSPHNRQFIARTPKLYSCATFLTAERWEKGLTTYLLARGNTAAWAPGPGSGARLVSGDPATTVLLVEADDDHAVVWTKPADLEFNPEDPRSGLGRPHGSGFFHDRGGLALFANGDIRFLPATADEGLLRALLSSAGREEVRFTYPWHEALFLRPVNLLLGPSFLLALVAIIGVVLVATRLHSEKPLSPGEMLWAITGTAFLVHALTVVVWYRYEPLPILKQDNIIFWCLPAFAATLISPLALVQFQDSPMWRALFGVNFLGFVLITLDALSPQQHRSVEESFVTATSPLWLGCVGVLAVCMTLLSRGSAAWAGRRLAHWAGLCVTLLPLLWFLVWFARGLVVPAPLFVRVLD